jgi:RNA polymerase sigma-70 factor (ECF subfamily)
MDALRRIYDKYKPNLLSVARSLLNDPASVEDVLHDVFVRFASQAGVFRLSGSLEGYLAICVANRARNINRANGRVFSKQLNEVETDQSDMLDPSETLGHKERDLIVTQALAELGEDQREVIALHVLGSLRFREIARQTGVSINTIQSRYRYGLAKLQSMLNGEVDA